MKTLTKITLFLALSLGLSPGAQANGTANVLNHVLNQVQTATARGKNPVVIFDLDDTLFDSRSRKLIIQKEFANASSTLEKYPAESAKLANLQLSQIRYYVQDTLNQLGISNPDFVRESVANFASKFFTNAYVKKDSTIPGAILYVNQIQKSGATIVYLTGRDEPRMGAGTRHSIRKNHFPHGNEVRLLLKPSHDIDDTDFKESAYSRIRRMGTVVAAFENEPRNINSMKAAFSSAQMVFLDTRHSDDPSVPHRDIPQIKNYQRSTLRGSAVHRKTPTESSARRAAKTTLPEKLPAFDHVFVTIY